MKSLIKLLVILALVLSALPAGADTFMVMGRAPLGSNEAAAKDAAVADALSRAVAQAAVSSLDPATLRSNLSLLQQQVLADSKRYITNYSLVASAPSGQDFLALVSVTIDQRALTQALIRAALKLPTSHLGTMLIMVSEETAPGRPPVYWWSGLPGAPEAPAPLAKVLKGMGIRIVNPRPLKALLTPDMRQPVLSESQALEFARQAGAQVVLLGSIRTYPLVTPQTIVPPPLVQLLALNTASGQVITIEETEGPTFHATPEPSAYPKILAQVEDSVRNLMARLSAKLGDAGPAAREIALKVSGVRSLGQLMRLEKAMMSMSDMVESVQRVSAGAGKASFSLVLKGSPSALADKLMVQNYGDFLINVVEQDKRALEVVIIPRQPGSQGAPYPGAMAPSQSGPQYAPDRWKIGPDGRKKQDDQQEKKAYPWEQGGQQQKAPQGGQQQQPQQQQQEQPQQQEQQQQKQQLYPWEQGQSGQGNQAQSGGAQQVPQKAGSANQPNTKQNINPAAAQGTGNGSGASGGSGKVAYPWEQSQ
ncbi:MAG: hypothetical protein KQH53_01105 [Desulfarculaceae bacterium]|nr:hypothetical protein [Desulfarculaceae bacterium]